MTSQNSGGQVLTDLQHNFRSSSKLQWHLRCLCQDQETLPTVDSDAILRKNMSLPEVKHAVWCELTVLLLGWTRYHGQVQIKTDEAKESTKRESKARTKIEQEPSNTRKSRHTHSLEACGAVQRHWRNSLTYLAGRLSWSVRSKLAGD